MSHPRTSGRELALQYLYMHDVLEGKDVQTFDAYIAAQETPPEKPSVEFAQKLVSSVLDHRAELDSEIAEVATNWNIKRMAAVDRNVLRLGLAELTICPETPHKVILNEAVELAKHYSSDDAGAFVNGLLDKLSSKHRSVDAPTPAAPAPSAEQK
ncbi:MAG TPA: transcription antitermination factor NusB [Planctomycetota bacterium]|nr:transcription antitermination factor NusB [Planctomycetota bacterium]